MTVSLGKRKRHADSSVRSDTNSQSHPRIVPYDEKLPRGEDSDNDERAKALFRRAFESKFQPLPENVDSVNDAEISSDDEDLEDDFDNEDKLSDWSGISGELTGEIEVVELSRTAAGPTTDELKREKKGFMSSKPPSSLEEVRMVTSAKSAKTGDSAVDGSEATNLKHDLALQRLLKESHLLDPTSFQSSSLEPQGKARLKALDMRLRDLGAKKSHLQQEKMPMSHRKGIISKATDREVARRREAAENGIVLEKARNGGKLSGRKRTRGIGGPTVGKFKGGTLSLSSRDVRSIEDQKTGGLRHKGRRR